MRNEYIFKGGNFVKIILYFLWKGVYSKRKEFAAIGSKFFPFRVDPFPKGISAGKSKQAVIKMFYFVKNDEKFTP